MPQRPENLYERYHAHVYFDEGSEAHARELCQGAWQACNVALGRFHRKPVGPHPRWSCQISFDADEFEHIVPWLDAHRGDLDILVHPLTGEVVPEHTTLAAWLGNEVPLALEVFEPANDN